MTISTILTQAVTSPTAVSVDWWSRLIAIGALLVAAISSIASWRSVKASREAVSAQLEIARETLKAQIEMHSKTTRAQTASANRMNWITTLRQHMASIAGLGIISLTQLELKHKGDWSPQRQQKFEHTVEELITRFTSVTLMLNSDKSLHNDLHIEINKLIEYFGNPEFKFDPDVSETFSRLRGVTRTLLKSEWERVKRGE